MVEVNYDAIERLLQARNISRRQLAKIIGVSPDTLAGSFRRKSKMKLFQLWQIANALSVKMIDLLDTDGNGHYNQEEIEKLEAEQIQFEFLANDDEIEEILKLLEKLNSKGLQIVKTIVTTLSEISELKANYSVSHYTITGEGQLTTDEYNSLMNSSTKKEEE